MFPQGHYEDWCNQFWDNNYQEAFELQNKLNLTRAEQQKEKSKEYWVKS